MMTEEKHIAIIKAEKREALWDINSRYWYGRASRPYGVSELLNEDRRYFMIIKDDDYFIECVGKFQENYEIWRGEIPKPTLEVGEELWINNLELLVKISKKYRTTNGEVVYETNHVGEVLYTEKTKESRLKVVEKWFTMLYPELETFNQLKSEFEQVEEPDEEPNKVENDKSEYVRQETYDLEEKPPKEPSWFGWLGFFKKGGDK